MIVSLFSLQKVIEKSLLLERDRDPLCLTRQYQLTSLGSLPWKALHDACSGSTSYDASHISYVAAGTTPCKRKELGWSCVSAKDQSWLILRDLPALSISVNGIRTAFFEHTLSRYPDFDIFTHISHFAGFRSFWLSWQDSRSFCRLEICFALGCRWRATTVTLSMKYFYARYFIAAGPKYANNSSAIIVWMYKNLRNIT